MAEELANVLQLAQTFAACNDFVGRAPWPAADPLVGLLRRGRPPPRLVAAMLPGGARAFASQPIFLQLSREKGRVASFSILLHDIVPNAAQTNRLCGIVWAEKLLDTTNPNGLEPWPRKSIGFSQTAYLTGTRE